MAEVGRVSIRLPSSIKQGDVIRVRTLVIHPMEIVQRDKRGKLFPKTIISSTAMTVAYNGKEVMRAELTQGVSQNPGLTFPLKVDRPGKLTVSYSDTTGKEYQGQARSVFLVHRYDGRGWRIDDGGWVFRSSILYPRLCRE